jgi:hypothetical protein
MANDAAHYSELAARARAEAEAATLDNVRDRALRSAATLEEMARQHERTVTLRVQREAMVERRAPATSSDGSRTQETHKEQT